MEGKTSRPVRVRFAPSPTGALHIGGVRTALFNYLFARQHGGRFILRIEDTDTTRYVPGAEDYIHEALDWCRLHADEGIRAGGKYGPYRQSERGELYQQEVQRLIENGWAYYAFDTAEELDAIRQEHQAKGEVFAYGYKTRMRMRNSLTLTEHETKHLLEDRDDWVIRFRIPEDRTIEMNDLIRGNIRVSSDTLDDKVLYKRKDGLPTYHLANIVDDYHMQISHVIRGEEWVPSLPLHYLLYEAFGWTERRPEFAHLPLILKPNGPGKLSKRDGDRLGFPVYPLQWTGPDGDIAQGYREAGYLPNAVLNILVLLGWNPGTDQEILSLSEMIDLFSLERVNKAGARFDPEKALWFNHQHMLITDHKLLRNDLLNRIKENQPSESSNAPEPNQNDLLELIPHLVERTNLLPELYDQSKYLWVDPLELDIKTIVKRTTPELFQAFECIAADPTLNSLSNEGFIPTFYKLIEENGWPKGKMMTLLRLALVGELKGIDLEVMARYLGANVCMRRIKAFVSCLHDLRADGRIADPASANGDPA